MNSLKRIDDETIFVDGIYYSTNSLKKVEIKNEMGYKVESIKLNGIRYYPYKEDKNNTKENHN
jgi:hypothetical protein